MGLRNWLYRAASLLGDVNAVQRGPKAIVKRVVRKRITKGVGSALNRIMKW